MAHAVDGDGHLPAHLDRSLGKGGSMLHRKPANGKVGNYIVALLHGAESQNGTGHCGENGAFVLKATKPRGVAWVGMRRSCCHLRKLSQR